MSVRERAVISSELLTLLHEAYGLRWSGEPVDLGGSVNLNLRVDANDGAHVVRVYCPWTTPERAAGMRLAKERIAQAGIPIARPRRTLDGEPFAVLSDRIVEVEAYVDGEPMDTWDRLLHGVKALAQIHDAMRGLTVHSDAGTAPYANYMRVEDVENRVREAVERTRREARDADELLLATRALWLCGELEAAQPASVRALPRQLAHGDFWDNNVLFRDSQLVAVLDFDFMGERARIEDIALILCYTFTSERFRAENSPARRMSRLRELVDTYDTSLQESLTNAERTALPYALVRNAFAPFCHLWRVGDPGDRRRYARAMLQEIEWLSEILADTTSWERLFALGKSCG